MTKPLDGVRVVEVSQWAFVPSAGVVLAEWGADVIKIEPPNGDPMRGLINAGVGAFEGISFPWELWNRGKEALTLDLTNPGAQEILLSLCEDADVLLTSYLPTVRRRLGFSEEAVRARNPNIVYACGSGQGYKGADSDKGGYDAISFWSRGSVASAATPSDYPRPIGMPAGAFGDSISGAALAGGIAAALLKKERTGEGSLVDVSLLGTAAWCMQMNSVGSAVFAAMMDGSSTKRNNDEPAQMPPMGPVGNPLVWSYKTMDNRWIMLCMLQPDRYWEDFVTAIGRADLISDPRFADPVGRWSKGLDFATEVQKTFLTRTLDEWRDALAQQPGQWDVVQVAKELLSDPQAVANRYVQVVEYTNDRRLPLFTSPVHFDRTPPDLTRAPEYGEHTDVVLYRLGFDDDAIIQAKVSGAVV
jgi:crotonobetainyl-CoA:carnitine CoA-transferase CaiB-like acyl-CoA transferase